NRRGSYNMDDEGTPGQRKVLIENGVLKGYLTDRLNGGLMGMPLTGNGRRQSYHDYPIPRMTNFFMEAGDSDPEEIVRSVDRGVYAAYFSGGQVDITNGNFTFSITEGYLIENGKLTTPIRGATLIGNGPDIMQKIVMVGSDLELDKGIGTCGKYGQSAPTGVGMPTVKVSEMTVGGTATSRSVGVWEYGSVEVRQYPHTPFRPHSHPSGHFDRQGQRWTILNSHGM
ncbi:MAG: metallopeptidase TldD-related protein, partial [Armatimonadetes bacterium]|nr:metallopeptidase TldD-related protein [Armatimonadota bacterium]